MALGLLCALTWASACSGSGSKGAVAVKTLTGRACGYFVNVGLFAGPQQLRGCGQPGNAPPTGTAPAVTLPPEGSATPITAADPDGAAAQYGPATIFGGIWPEDVASTPPSGPITVSTQGTRAGQSVTSSADVVFLPQPVPSAAPLASRPYPSRPAKLRAVSGHHPSRAKRAARDLHGLRNGCQALDEVCQSNPVDLDGPVGRAKGSAAHTRRSTAQLHALRSDHQRRDVFVAVFNEQIITMTVRSPSTPCSFTCSVRQPSARW